MRRLASIVTVPFLCFGCRDAAQVPNQAPNADGAKAAERRNVVSLSPAAATKVRELQQKTPNSYLRVAVKGGGPTGFQYDLDLDDSAITEKDYLGESRGIKIAVDRKSAAYLEGVSIDWLEGAGGFKFGNPKPLK